jgi:GT2 family glycosyltransferase
MNGRPSADTRVPAVWIPWPIRAWDLGCEACAHLALRTAQRLACHRGHLPVVLRRLLRLIWWTLTLQLWRRFGEWTRARRARRVGGRREAVRPPLAMVAPRVPNRFRLSRAAHPVVSIIIPTHGQVQCTLRCLAAIAAHPPSAPIEVIVVDDASGDPAVARLERVEGIRLIRQTRNLGFLHTCNATAKLAVGAYLLFLNNDTEPCAGWLDAMLTLALARPGVGAVGAKLIYPDGRLQEAGGIIWNDGTGWNYGRGDDPDKPEYNYVREVDYCSAAALLVPRAVFASLGGFDPRYAPAYFEDSDLAFRLRAAGYQVLYEPRAVVVHLEGASHGTDAAHGIKAHQEINRDSFVTRWADVLAAEHFAPGTEVLRARDRARARPVVLVIDHRVPEPDRDAGSRTMLAFVQALLQAGAVVKFWSDCPELNRTREAALQTLGVEAHRGTWRPFVDWIARNGAELDHVLLSRPDVAERYLPLLRRASRARITFYGHDLHHARMRQHAVTEHDPKMAHAAERMLRRERRVWRNADVVLYPSQAEVDRVAVLEPAVAARAVQPYGFADFAPPRPAVSGHTLLFVAGFAHSPNEDAAFWLVRDIMPLVRRQVPLVRLAIVGSQPTARVRALAGADVTIAADVSDAELHEWYVTARVAVVPLRYGAGVKRKVVEALCEGVPLVTTSVGAQGVSGLDAVAAVRDTAEEIAVSLIAVLRDDGLWLERSAAGTAYARAHFAAATQRRLLCQAMGLPDAVPPYAPHLAHPLLADLGREADQSGAQSVPDEGDAGGEALTRVAALTFEATQRREPLLEVGDQVGNVLQPDMQPHQRAGELGARRARDEAGGRQRQALEPAPGRADAEQRERLDERVGALD